MNFDFDRAMECAKIYSQSTGINCSLIDENGNTIGSNNCDVGCSFCDTIQNNPEIRAQCRSTHKYGSYQAERYGGKYIFFCPLGLVHWASPILHNGMLKGAFLGGPVHMVEPDELLYEDLERKIGNNKKLLDSMWLAIKNIQIVPPERVSHLSELLFITATHVSKQYGDTALEMRNQQAIQSDISEYIQYIKSMGGDEADYKSYPLEKEKELISMIANGNKAGAQKVLNEILGHIFFSTGGNYKILKARVLELIVLLSRAALEGGADIELIFGMNYDYIYQINNFKTVDQLTYWLSKIMIRFTDCVFNLSNVKHVDVIYKAVNFIKRNYMNKITLEDVAAEVHLSPAYFSKVFKNEMNCNFNQYLNKIRIERSKELLNNNSIPLIDVSNLSGFEDQSYFSKVFKKITGISPGRYRENLMRSS